jgi:hypothetical protein
VPLGRSSRTRRIIRRKVARVQPRIPTPCDPFDPSGPTRGRKWVASTFHARTRAHARGTGSPPPRSSPFESRGLLAGESERPLTMLAGPHATFLAEPGHPRPPSIIKSGRGLLSGHLVDLRRNGEVTLHVSITEIGPKAKVAAFGLKSG